MRENVYKVKEMHTTKLLHIRLYFINLVCIGYVKSETKFLVTKGINVKSGVGQGATHAENTTKA